MRRPRPLTFSALPFDRFNRAIERIKRLAQADGVDVRLPVLWDATDPLAGLS
jgi:hypothetical protein